MARRDPPAPGERGCSAPTSSATEAIAQRCRDRDQDLLNTRASRLSPAVAALLLGPPSPDRLPLRTTGSRLYRWPANCSDSGPMEADRPAGRAGSSAVRLTRNPDSPPAGRAGPAPAVHGQGLAPAVSAEQNGADRQVVAAGRQLPGVPRLTVSGTSALQLPHQLLAAASDGGPQLAEGAAAPQRPGAVLEETGHR